MTLGAAQSMFATGALATKYMLMAPEYTMHVGLVRSARWQSVWVQLAVTVFMSGKGEGGDVVSRVGLKLAV